MWPCDLTRRSCCSWHVACAAWLSLTERMWDVRFTSEDLRAQIRGYFEEGRVETDRQTIKFLLSDGIHRLKLLEEMLGMRA
eukprot:6939046-Pyramimonas_sp.AAC.2